MNPPRFANPAVPGRGPGRLAGRAALCGIVGVGLVAGLVALDRFGAAPLADARAAAPAAAPAAVKPADPATFGRDLAAGCAGCHDTDGRAVGTGVVIAGMPADRMVAVMTEFRDGQRPGTVMPQLAKGYTPAQIRLIADYFATKAPK